MHTSTKVKKVWFPGFTSNLLFANKYRTIHLQTISPMPVIEVGDIWKKMTK